ncbi:MAG: signal peptidase I [Cyanobacteria bacterium J06621_11]
MNNSRRSQPSTYPTQQRDKDCWLAVNLSGLIPGAGQCYGNLWSKGLIIFGVFFTLVSRALWALLAAEGSTAQAFWLLGAAAIIYFLNVWDAFATVGRPAYPLGDKRKGRDLWYSVFLSQILPGLGHLYLNQAVVGGLFLALGVSLAMLANHRPFLLPLACTVWSLAGYHAYRTAPLSLNRTGTKRITGSHSSRSAQMLIIVILGSLLLRLSIGSLPMWIDQAVLQCVVPSESMLPTLQVNDRIFVSRNPLYYPRSGDIVVFHAPPEAVNIIEAEAEDLFVKRIVATPGQKVSVREGRVLVNNMPIEEAYTSAPANYRWGPELVPPDEYFVLGDNRIASADSHVWGFLPRDYIVGEAYKIYWPTDRVRSLRK